MPEVVSLCVKAQRECIEAFLHRAGLRMEPGLAYYCGVFDGDELIAGGGYEGNVIKCLAVDEAHRGEDLMSAVASHLYTKLRQAGTDNIFVFTKPAHDRLFRAMGFAALAKTDDALLLESRKNGIDEAIAAWRRETPETTGMAGAVVMNANPFTLGHQYLLEQAAHAVSLLHVFVVQEDKSAFPFDVRLALVRAGAAHINNAVVHAGGSYVISAATFPSYFLKDPSGASAAYAKLDAALFAKRIAPALSISARFVGTEPADALTALYNDTLACELPRYGVALTVIDRRCAADTVISASAVRRLFAAGDTQQLAKLVPESTLQYLSSPEGERLRQRLAAAVC